jgi:hypothetical protein
MGYRRRNRRYRGTYTQGNDTTYTTTLVIALYLAGFFCFGVTWLAIPFLFVN